VNGGRLPFNVKLMLEGQEEVLSPDLRDFLSDPAVQAKFKADYLVSADGSQPGHERPGLLVGLRGVCGLEVQVCPSTLCLSFGCTARSQVELCRG